MGYYIGVPYFRKSPHNNTMTSKVLNQLDVEEPPCISSHPRGSEAEHSSGVDNKQPK